MGPVRRLRLVTSGGVADSELSETDLIKRVSKGDKDAYGELYGRVAGKVHAVVLKVLRDPAQSEEVAQEVMVELWRTASRFDSDRGSVGSWAVTVAHRRAVDRVRSSQAARNREEADLSTRQMPASGADEVAEEVESRQDTEMVATAMDSLTEAQRESIQLAYFEGYTYREVAALLDLPEGTVKTRIRDGLIRLRDEMGVTS